jgi:hypothetical protein
MTRPPKHLRYRLPNRGAAGGPVPAAEVAADRRDRQAIVRFFGAVLGTERLLPERVVELLGSGPLTAREIAAELEAALWPVRKCLGRLRGKGVVVLSGPRHLSRWSLRE